MIINDLTFLRDAAPAPDGIPKHVHLSDLLRAAIAAGIWQPGDRLPADVLLTRMTPYSLRTVQRALRSLVDEGVVIRRRGNGSFVADDARRALPDPLHCRFLADGGDGFMPVYPRVLSRVRTDRDGPWAEALGSAPTPMLPGQLAVGGLIGPAPPTSDGRGTVTPGYDRVPVRIPAADPAAAGRRHRRGAIVPQDPGNATGRYLRIDRLFDVGDEFSVYSIFVGRADRLGTLAAVPVPDLDGVNFKKVIAYDLAMPITDLVQDLVAEHISPAYARAMGLQPGTDGLRLDITAKAAQDDVLYWQRFIIPPTERQLCLDSRLPVRNRW